MARDAKERMQLPMVLGHGTTRRREVPPGRQLVDRRPRFRGLSEDAHTYFISVCSGSRLNVA